MQNNIPHYCAHSNFLQSQIVVEVGFRKGPRGRGFIKSNHFEKFARDERKVGVIVAYGWPVDCCVHADLVAPHIVSAVVVRVCLVYSDFLAIALDSKLWQRSTLWTQGRPLNEIFACVMHDVRREKGRKSGGVRESVSE